MSTRPALRRPLILPPAPNPCGSCPYRRDVPSGVWSLEEYAKLPSYDGETGDQPFGIFLCHQQDGRACAGWVGCHDMDESLAFRLAAATGRIENPDAFLDYATPTPLFASGAEAAQHGVEAINDPDVDARRVIDRLGAKLRKRDPQ